MISLGSSPYHKVASGFAEEITEARNELSKANKELKVIENSDDSPANKAKKVHNIKAGQQTQVNTILVLGKKMETRIAEEAKKKSQQ